MKPKTNLLSDIIKVRGNHKTRIIRLWILNYTKILKLFPKFSKKNPRFKRRKKTTLSPWINFLKIIPIKPGNFQEIFLFFSFPPSPLPFHPFTVSSLLLSPWYDSGLWRTFETKYDGFEFSKKIFISPLKQIKEWNCEFLNPIPGIFAQNVDRRLP